MKSAFIRILPVGLALSPIGFLFGVLAAQMNWSTMDVLLLSTIGFTGSGQFAFLSFAQQGIQTIGSFVIFVVILSMNLRYIPMSLSASQPLDTSPFCKFVLSHCLADESYATEKKDDDLKSRIVIRISLFLFWVLSTVAGCALAVFLPQSIGNELAGLTFPVNAILFALSLMNVLSYVRNDIVQAARWTITSVLGPVISLAVAFILIKTIGERYFWIPSIMACYLTLSRTKRSTDK
ncbi:AzlC family ABC transporter permease [Verminephrobacter eiseniae]|uniref:AzlC family ABC transporter permease n=1 Tax=Verminephrobacter eiseniae TaxID=364317 RepID=UPI0022371080|nr:AzlC family ABC transporter permease [Verminephrobacter eiseniae]MCW5238879.1 branched-chain amino acid ABC transporter permease [Verminephrobacter eiseniae]